MPSQHQHNTEPIVIKNETLRTKPDHDPHGEINAHMTTQTCESCGEEINVSEDICEDIWNIHRQSPHRPVICKPCHENGEYVDHNPVEEWADIEVAEPLVLRVPVPYIMVENDQDIEDMAFDRASSEVGVDYGACSLSKVEQGQSNLIVTVVVTPKTRWE